MMGQQYLLKHFNKDFYLKILNLRKVMDIYICLTGGP